MKGFQLTASPLQAGSAPRFAGLQRSPAGPARRSLRTYAAADRPLWFPDEPLDLCTPASAKTVGTQVYFLLPSDTAVCSARSNPPKHLDGSLPADFGFDPLGLGGDPEFLKWAAESERVHARWAMLAVAGILAQEIVRPDIFWYDAPVKIQLPFNIIGLVAFELFAMHFVETKRGLDLQKPGSQDQDPLFPNNKLPKHDVGYPGGIFAPFVPGNLEELKVKELKNGRLAMLAFAGFVMSAQVTGVGPLAALQQHLADPINTTIFSKAAVVPGAVSQPPCAIEPVHNFQGLNIPTPCFLRALWP